MPLLKTLGQSPRVARSRITSEVERCLPFSPLHAWRITSISRERLLAAIFACQRFYGAEAVCGAVRDYLLIRSSCPGLTYGRIQVVQGRGILPSRCFQHDRSCELVGTFEVLDSTYTAVFTARHRVNEQRSDPGREALSSLEFVSSSGQNSMVGTSRAFCLTWVM